MISLARHRPSWPAAAVVALAIFAVTCMITPPVPGDGDSGEFTLVLARATLAHPTGYPLYTMLGHAFVVAAHAAGVGWALAAALWSAVGGAFAAFFLFLLADRLCGDGPVIGRATRFFLAAVPTVLFSMNPMVTFETTHAEVYAWHVAWTCGAALLFLRLAGSLGQEAWPETRKVARGAAVWGFICGAGFTHHTTSLLIAAPLSIVLGWMLLRRRPRQVGPIVIAAVAALVALASYGFVFWKIAHPDPLDWPFFERDVQGALDHINATQYKSWAFGDFKPTEIHKAFLARWIYPWLFPGLALLVATAFLRGHRPGARVSVFALVVAAAAATAFTFRLRLDDPTPYFLAPMALGLAAVAPIAAAIGHRLGRRGARVLVAALVTLSLVVAASWFVTARDRRGTMEATESLFHDMWRKVPQGPGILFFENDMFLRLRAYQALDGENPEILVVKTDLFAAPSVQRALAAIGIDPLANLGEVISGLVTQQEYWQGVHRNVNRQTSLPVYEFDPERGVLRMLRKTERAAESR